MFRIILIILLVLVAIRLFKNLRRSFQSKTPRHPTDTVSGTPQEMVSCHRCGTFIVKSSALYNGNNYYCGESCRLGN